VVLVRAAAMVVRRAHRRYVAAELAAGADAARVKRLSGLLHVNRIRAVAGLARGIVEVESDQFDNHPDLLNVNNGVVHLPTGQLRPHNPALHLTKVTTVNYRPDARHGDWTRALTALPPEVAEYMQLRCGQAATGHQAPDDVMPVLRGSGANGKTTFTKAIHAALGDHSTVIPDRVLLANPGDHPTELTTLRGARHALLEELPEGRRLTNKRLKDLNGTSPMTARSIGRNNVTWTASHSLMLTTNYLPIIDEVDLGTWRRLALVEFPYRFTPGGTDPAGPGERAGADGLRERLVEGADGRGEAVLAWIVEGARRWYTGGKVGIPAPAKVVTDTKRWRADADRVFAYFDERLIPDRDSYVAAADLYADFTNWHVGHGNMRWNDQTFTARFECHEQVRRAAIERRRVYTTRAGLSRPSDLFGESLPARTMAWLGVRFRTKADADAEQEPRMDTPPEQHKYPSAHDRSATAVSIRPEPSNSTPHTACATPRCRAPAAESGTPSSAGGKPIPVAPANGRRPPEPTELCPDCQRWTAVRNLDQYDGICGTCHQTRTRATR